MNIFLPWFIDEDQYPFQFPLLDRGMGHWGPQNLLEKCLPGRLQTLSHLKLAQNKKRTRHSKLCKTLMDPSCHCLCRGNLEYIIYILYIATQSNFAFIHELFLHEVSPVDKLTKYVKSTLWSRCPLNWLFHVPKYSHSRESQDPIYLYF